MVGVSLLQRSPGFFFNLGVKWSTVKPFKKQYMMLVNHMNPSRRYRGTLETRPHPMHAQFAIARDSIIIIINNN